MKVKVVVIPDSRLLRSSIVIEDEDNPQNYLIVTTNSVVDSLQSIISQLEQYLKDHK